MRYFKLAFELGTKKGEVMGKFLVWGILLILVPALGRAEDKSLGDQYEFRHQMSLADEAIAKAKANLDIQGQKSKIYLDNYRSQKSLFDKGAIKYHRYLRAEMEYQRSQLLITQFNALLSGAQADHDFWAARLEMAKSGVVNPSKLEWLATQRDENRCKRIEAERSIGAMEKKYHEELIRELSPSAAKGYITQEAMNDMRQDLLGSVARLNAATLAYSHCQAPSESE